ncbi:MAG: DUF2273 domain-containing protein, partial [Tetragenococcus koreensis]|nr:DUF2273 domain-containing protein [Tetragenococcus koreensis]
NQNICIRKDAYKYILRGGCQMQEFLQRYRDGIIGGGIGLILAILLLMIGFLKTLLVIVCTFVGAFIGIYLNRTGFFERFKNPRR